MKNKLVAERYSKAIIGCVEPKDYNGILCDINVLQQLFNQSSNLAKSADSLLFSRKNRIELVKQIPPNLLFQDIWSNLFEILVKKNRFRIISKILDDLEVKILNENGKIKVLLKIARQQSDEMMAKISVKISDILQKKIVLTVQIQPEIIGGFVAETESISIDGSIKNNLIKLIKR
ncbi:MAG: hypothetical protein HN952_08005 [Candidatus Cloacimonetes bacterium]|jgi:F-type H+-transporting ATPase subunit delta|nr:hypothetical protein [Candidatus Cloacimonadota bacterium]MBT6994876.1 hypothetical protein [Candidatus Cloacimonadota bacterium]MBT7468811.1 hypothetical protein [Candidatus Cloacimonadota bacterium]